jgi:hypothetical protein
MWYIVGLLIGSVLGGSVCAVLEIWMERRV